MSLTVRLIIIKISISVITPLLKNEPFMGKGHFPKKMKLHKSKTVR